MRRVLLCQLWGARPQFARFSLFPASDRHDSAVGPHTRIPTRSQRLGHCACGRQPPLLIKPQILEVRSAPLSALRIRLRSSADLIKHAGSQEPKAGSALGLFVCAVALPGCRALPPPPLAKHVSFPFRGFARCFLVLEYYLVITNCHFGFSAKMCLSLLIMRPA